MAEKTTQNQERRNTGPGLYIFRGQNKAKEFPLSEAEGMLRAKMISIARLTSDDDAIAQEAIEIIEVARAAVEQIQLRWMLANNKAALAEKGAYDVAVFLYKQSQAARAVLDAAYEARLYRRYRTSEGWKSDGQCPYRYELDKASGEIRLSSDTVAASRVLYHIAKSTSRGARRSYAEVGDKLVAMGAIPRRTLTSITKKYAVPLTIKAGGKAEDLNWRPRAGRQVAQATGGLTARLGEIAQQPN
ncbi:hypothetical protein HN358_03955 [Candidatus Uhrbacteria bacterium]|nr:hypothetical protein [Candidatus Uhrbacteria bacterium]MBT7716932.1 hypothetical protein [Candidatus Uhrbacteria bacterium]